MSALEKAVEVEDAVLAMSETPEGWGIAPLGVLIRRAIVGSEKGDLLAEFTKVLEDELEMLEQAAVDVQYSEHRDDPHDYELALSDQLMRLRTRLHAVREIDWRIKNPNWLVVAEQTAAEKAPAVPVDQRIEGPGDRFRKPRKRGRRG